MFGKKSPTSSDKFALAPVETDDGSLEIPPDPLRKQDDSLYTPSQAKTRKSVEQLLMERGLINEEHLLQARTVQIMDHRDRELRSFDRLSRRRRH